MRKLFLVLIIATLVAYLVAGLCVLVVKAQDDPTPIPVVVTVILVFPSDTPTMTPTETPTPTPGPSPTPTATITPTPALEVSENVNGQDVVIRYEVTPGDAGIIGLLSVLVGLALVELVRRRR